MQYFLMCSIFRNIKNVFLIPVVPKKMTRLLRAPVLPLVTPNTDWYYKSAPYFGIQTWNILPVHVRNSVTLDMFKTVFKRYLFVKIYLSGLLAVATALMDTETVLWTSNP